MNRKNWVETTLDEIAEINPSLDKSDLSDDLLVSFVPMPSVQAKTGKINLTETRKLVEVKKGFTSFQKNDVLFAKITPCMENGKMAIVPSLLNNVGFGSTEFHVLRPRPGINPAFIYYFVSSDKFRSDAEHNMTGAVGQRRVPTQYLKNHPISIPPLSEQCRIVAKIEELFAEIAEGTERILKAKELLKGYRQSLLKSAFEGKLTEEWRKANESILENKTDSHNSYETDRNLHHKENLRDICKNNPLYKLPKGWVWTNLGDSTLLSQNGLSKRKGASGVDVPVLRLADIKNNKINTFGLRTIICTEKEIDHYRLSDSDILCIRVNGSKDLVGRLVIFKNTIEPLLFCDHFIRIRLLDIQCATFLSFYNQTLTARRFIETSMVSTAGQHTISQSNLLRMPIPLPPKQEQKKIIQILEKSIYEADVLENYLNALIKNLESLRQSILKKAFLGKLVSQNADDESTMILMNRIKTEKECSSFATTRKNSKQRQKVIL